MSNKRVKLSEILERSFTAETMDKLKTSMMLIREKVKEHRNEVKQCPCCSQPIDDVVTQYPKEVVLEVLGMSMEFVRLTQRYEFDLKELQKVVGRQLSHTAYCNINHFVRFGGIMFRPKNPKTGEPYKSGHYGINMDRAREFFKGIRNAPVRIVRNRFTDEKEYTKVSIHDFPSVKQFINEDGEYNPYA